VFSNSYIEFGAEHRRLRLLHSSAERWLSNLVVVKSYFPAELWSTLDPSEGKTGAPSAKRKRLSLHKSHVEGHDSDEETSRLKRVMQDTSMPKSVREAARKKKEHIDAVLKIEDDDEDDAAADANDEAEAEEEQDDAYEEDEDDAGGDYNAEQYFDDGEGDDYGGYEDGGGEDEF
jgi:DNA-directed RNA polymerase III subunit RPC7